ncbi:hypothetical protein Shal_1968 [Shewanella halifaxensis HAW-EB4]|uniref:PKD domain containing protein n=1 Tax=Shewanella halifaxensis (strain HAW-EB4) TaxID=458817 RepID=B0TSF2_SHEHH|nr:PKD domain-containing protein [Shewanella halifaxensis]ABZ76532.1 hypothetical protein Shal_1968 [Shewanella halifaxensis HAW-EB4]
MRLRLLFVNLVLYICSANVGASDSFSFTEIANTKTDFVTASQFATAFGMNNSGEVVFNVEFQDGTAAIYKATDIDLTSNLTLTLIRQSFAGHIPANSSYGIGINDEGTIAFNEFLGQYKQIFTGTNEPFVSLADTPSYYTTATDINNSGQVAFSTQDELVVTDGVNIVSELMPSINVRGSAVINDNGEAAVCVALSEPPNFIEAIRLNVDNSLHRYSLGTRADFGNPNYQLGFNNSGNISYSANGYSTDGHAIKKIGLITSEGNLSLVDTHAGFIRFFDNTSLNDFNQVLFAANKTDSGSIGGLYLVDSSGEPPITVIETGDIISGKQIVSLTVGSSTAISTSSLNNLGQIVFAAQVIDIGTTELYSALFRAEALSVYNESVDGDLPESYDVNLTMKPGANTIIGTNSIGDSGDSAPVMIDWDWLTVTIPPEYQLSAVNVEYSNLDATGSILGLEAYLAFYNLASEQVELQPNFPQEPVSVLDAALPLAAGEYQFQMTSQASFSPPFNASYDYKIEFILVSATDGLPIANAGEDQTARLGDTIILDGTSSFDDNTPTESLGYNWSFSSLPSGSTVSLTQANSANPSFVIDAFGEYTVELIVTDNLHQSSMADSVLISTHNLAPTSVAGADQLVIVNTLVSLDGSASYDPELDDMTFSWSVISTPSGSNASFTDTDTMFPSLIPDMEGSYELQLVTGDHLGLGTPDNVTIFAALPEEYVEIEVMHASADAVSLEQVEITTDGNQQAMLNFLSQAVLAIDSSDSEEAIVKLEQAISRVDGCALRGVPDNKGKGRDWVVTCDAQADIYMSLTNALEALVQMQ